MTPCAMPTRGEHSVNGRIQPQITGDYSWSAPGRAAQQRTQSSDQLGELKRLGQVVIPAGTEPSEAIDHLVARG